MATPLRHTFWFIATSTRNQVRRFVGRLKSPRYAIAVILGVLYFGFILIGPLLMPDDGERPGRGMVGLMRTGGALVMLLLAATWWLWRTNRDGIMLSPAEANMLVPAPLTRPQLIRFKLMTAQPSLLLSAFIMSLLTHGSALPLVLRFPASWALLTTLQLHRFGSSLVHTSVAEQGRAGWRRVWPAALLFAAVLAALVIPAVQTYLRDGGLIVTQMMALMGEPPASIALAPFNAVMAAVNATTSAGWMRAFAIAVAILVAHYVWVIRMDAAFEEGAADAGARRAKLVEAVRSGNMAAARAEKNAGKAVRPPWFPLGAMGEPAVAILWKNVLGVTRGIAAKLVMSIIGIAAFMAVIISRGSDDSGPGFLGMIGIMGLSYGGLITFLAPGRIRHDFRTDLRRIELLRTLPLGGTRLAAAEITTSTIVLTLMQFALLTVGLVAMVASGQIRMTGQIVALIVPAAVLFIGLNATMMTFHNGFAIVFPAWSGQKPGGVEMFGLAMLTVFASLLLFVLSLIGPIVVGGVAAMSMLPAWGTRAYIPGGAAAIIAVFVQLALLLVWLGRAYDRMDPTGRGGILS